MIQLEGQSPGHQLALEGQEEGWAVGPLLLLSVPAHGSCSSTVGESSMRPTEYLGSGVVSSAKQSSSKLSGSQ